MTASGRKRLWIAIAIVAGLPLLLPLIALPGAKGRVLEALRAGLGRPIAAQALHLHVYPVPGVELDQVRLGEDPAFGLEDMVVADSATANVRLLSLFSGRLTFSRIHLEGASINLVRNQRGEWNITALLDRTAHGGTSLTPRALSPAQRFPYLDWSDARINFKLEQTKQRFYLDQVEGSLARDSSGWRLQAQFQPERTDLNLSNTGEVTLDGRWPAAATGFHQRPFEIELRLRNSYLAGSSALLAGHDVGVRGVVNAQMHVAGNGQQFNMSGSAEVDSLRRWDLLPPTSRIQAAFAATYEPGQDRLQIAGIGDPGFQHVRLQGEVTNLFARPVAHLHLEVVQAPAAWILPLVLGVKAQVPANLQLSGDLGGTADLAWQGKLVGNGTMQLNHVAISNDRAALALQPALLQWNGATLLVAPTAAALLIGNQPTVTLTVDGQASASGFELGARARKLNQAEMSGLAALVSVVSPWPAGLEGAADAQLQWQATWGAASKGGWSGSMAWPAATFQGAGRLVALRGLSISLADPQPRLARFTARMSSQSGASEVSGSVRWRAASGQPLQFSLRVPELQESTAWHELRPAPAGLVDKVLGDPPVPWWTDLRSEGSLNIGKLDWHGVQTSLQASLASEGGTWVAPHVQLRLAGGTIIGQGSLRHSLYQASGVVTPVAPLGLARLLEGTVWRGLLRGDLAGKINLSWPETGASLDHIEANGVFTIARGGLRTEAGLRAFDQFQGGFQLDQGSLRLTQLVWRQGGEVYRGEGSADFGSTPGKYRLDLKEGTTRLRLTGVMQP